MKKNSAWCTFEMSGEFLRFNEGLEDSLEHSSTGLVAFDV
jgi:hypothetical protein